MVIQRQGIHAAFVTLKWFCFIQARLHVYRHSSAQTNTGTVNCGFQTREHDALHTDAKADKA